MTSSLGTHGGSIPPTALEKFHSPCLPQLRCSPQALEKNSILVSVPTGHEM